MEKIKLGIVGFGFMGHEYLKIIDDIKEIELKAVCDIESKQLQDAPEQVKTFNNVDDFLAFSEIDTVIVSVPNPLHHEVVLKAAKAGKHIICEKPAAMSVAEFDEMVQATQEAKVTFTVHHQRRWDSDYRIMKEVYDQKLVGDMYIIKSQLYGVNGNMHDWHIYPEMGGGMLYDWGVHLIDQMLNMLDSEIETIYADVQNVINEKVDDYFKIITKFKNGITTEIELGTYYLTPKRTWFIGGKKGSAMIDGFGGGGKIVRTKHLLENVPEKITMTSAGPTRSFGPPAPGLLYEEDLPEVQVNHRDYFKNYVQARKGEEEFAIKPEQVRRVLVFMDAVRESSRKGETVRMK